MLESIMAPTRSYSILVMFGRKKLKTV